MKPLKGVLTVFLILLAVFVIGIQEANRVKTKQIVYVSDTIVDTTTTHCNGFQFMTKGYCNLLCGLLFSFFS